MKEKIRNLYFGKDMHDCVRAYTYVPVQVHAHVCFSLPTSFIMVCLASAQEFKPAELR
jgi:hypothetical protein